MTNDPRTSPRSIHAASHRRRRPPRTSSGRGRRLFTVALLGPLAAAATWNVFNAEDDVPASPPAPIAHERLVERTLPDGITITVPATWERIAADHETVTWGTSSRSHTVTVAAAPSGDESLLVVAHQAARDIVTEIPASRVTQPPTLLNDTNSYAPPPIATSFLVTTKAGTAPAPAPLHVRQVWTRDTTRGRDIVATWTSSDEQWPVSLDSAPALPT